MPKITPEMRAIKSQYLEAERNHDTKKMNQLKQKAMSEMKKAKSQGTEKINSNDNQIKNEDGDILDLSKKGN